VQAYTTGKPVADNSNQFTVSILPNPATHYFTVMVNSRSSEPVNLRVTDGAGRVVEMLQKVRANQPIRIGANYIPGLYYVEVIQGTNRVVLKVIRQ
jgi:hypothetical protein